MVKKQTSPSFKPITNDLGFSEAIGVIITGKKVTRSDWDNPDVYGFMQDDTLMLHQDSKDHIWILTLGDIEANDWSVL